jgi:hypothetical protein
LAWCDVDDQKQVRYWYMSEPLLTLY